jgi:hypothetical protein
MEALLNICSAFGLSGAAGLNAYIPLLTVSIMHKCGVITLAKPYDIMGQWWVIIVLGVLLAIELLADKIPGADHVNDIIHSFIRPTAGALIFAAQMGGVSWVHPGVWLVIGLLLAGSVHAGKAIVRPIINVGTAGIGAPIVSAVENVVSVTLSVVAVLAPIVAVILLLVSGWVLVILYRRFFGKRRLRAQPVPDESALVSVDVTASPTRWDGGV